MMDNIVAAIQRGDFDDFREHLKNEDSLLQKYGPLERTALHAVAAMPEVGAAKSFFTKQTRTSDFYYDLQSALRGTKLWEEAVKIQDNKGNTPIHIGILHEKWYMVGEMGRTSTASYLYDPRYVRNNDNLTELGLAMALYGIGKGLDDLSSIFESEQITILSFEERLKLLREHTC